MRKRRDRPYPIQFGIFYAALRATASTVPVDLLSAFRERHRPILRARCQIDAFTQTLQHQKARARKHERRDTVALTTLNFVGSAGRIIVPFLSARPYLSERKMLATSTTRSFGYCYSRHLMRVVCPHQRQNCGHFLAFFAASPDSLLFALDSGTAAPWQIDFASWRS